MSSEEPKYQALKPDNYERPKLNNNEETRVWFEIYKEAIASFGQRKDPGTTITYAQRAADIAVLRMREFEVEVKAF